MVLNPLAQQLFPNDKLDTFTPGGTRELLRYPRQSLEALWL